MTENAVAAGVLVALLLTSAVAVGAAVADTHEDDRNESNDSFGAEVSSFMQASSAETETEVDEGMFQASMRRAETDEERQSLIEERKQRLAERHAQLQERREEIANDESDAKNSAVATRVMLGAEGIERSVDSTREQADRFGVETADLEQLRDMAGELNGRDVAEWARGIAGNGDPAANDGSADDDRSGDWRGSPGADRGEENESNGTDDGVGVDSGFGD